MSRRPLRERTGRHPVTQPSPLLYPAIRALINAVKAIATRAEVTGLEHFPRRGGVLVVSNHISHVDPVVLIGVAPRPVVFMAKAELYRPGLQEWFLRQWGGGFPVRRGEADVAAVRDALDLVHAGLPVVVFPEGTRQPAGLGPAHPGVGYLATRAGCPVLPVGIEGTERLQHLWGLRRRPRFRVSFGAPVVVPPEMSAGAAVDDIMERIAALLPPPHRGVYGAHDGGRRA